MRVIIAKNPYAEILKILEGRTTIKELEKFKMYYQGMEEALLVCKKKTMI